LHIGRRAYCRDVLRINVEKAESKEERREEDGVKYHR
jgi:hypothetical protein